MTVASLPETSTGRRTVVLVDQDRLSCRGSEVLLDDLSGGTVRIVGRVEDGGAAVDLVRRHQPDVVIVSLSLAPPGGTAAISQVKRSCPGIPVLALAGADDLGVTLTALRAGADGVPPRSSDALLAPVLSLEAGFSVVPGAVLRALLGASGRRRAGECLRNLSHDDLELWRLVAEGVETREICRRLFLSERTVKRRVASLLRRLGVNSRVRAAALAGRCGLLDQL